MPTRTIFLVPALSLGLVACSQPEVQPSLEKTRDADRLDFDFRTFHAPTTLIQPGVHGAARVRLGVRSDGTVASAEQIDGSDAVWRYIRVAVHTIRFKAADPADRGPWEVTLAVLMDPSHGGGRRPRSDAHATGYESAFSMKILDVKTAPTQP